MYMQQMVIILKHVMMITKINTYTWMKIYVIIIFYNAVDHGLEYKILDRVVSNSQGWVGFLCRLNVHMFNNHHPDNINRLNGG